MSANIATDYSFKKIVSKSTIFNVIYNVDIKSYISSDISISVYNFFDDYEYFSLFIQQSYGYRVTDRLLYNLGFEYFYHLYSIDPRKYNTIRLFTDIKYDIGKFLFRDNKQFLKINVGSRLFYDFIDNIGLTTNLNIFNNIRLKLEEVLAIIHLEFCFILI